MNPSDVQQNIWTMLVECASEWSLELARLVYRRFLWDFRSSGVLSPVILGEETEFFTGHAFSPGSMTAPRSLVLPLLAGRVNSRHSCG